MVAFHFLLPLPFFRVLFTTDMAPPLFLFQPLHQRMLLRFSDVLFRA
ncbi:hypothetical protein V6Z12_A11G133100 [Gossypium hirsutum]